MDSNGALEPQHHARRRENGIIQKPKNENINHPNRFDVTLMGFSVTPTYFIHFTKPGQIKIGGHTEFGDYTEKGTAFQVLGQILYQRTLFANQGKGILKTTKAVCFTEKPLGAVKELFAGTEAQERIKRNVISFQPYGVAFSKKYLVENFDITPVIAVQPNQINDIPTALQYRVILSDFIGIDWTHEREWRVGSDVRFDPQEALVFVLTAEEANLMKEFLLRTRINVKAIVPLELVFEMI